MDFTTREGYWIKFYEVGNSAMPKAITTVRFITLLINRYSNKLRPLLW
jgi:hypothetical protein